MIAGRMPMTGHEVRSDIAILPQVIEASGVDLTRDTRAQIAAETGAALPSSRLGSASPA